MTGLRSQLWYDRQCDKSLVSKTNLRTSSPSASHFVPHFGLVSIALAFRLKSGFCTCILIEIAAYHGFGKHGGDPTFFLHVHFFSGFWYMTGLMLTKLSVLCFYLRIFTVTPYVKLAIWTTSVLVTLYWVVVTILIIRQCDPIPHYWDSSIPGTCFGEFPLIIGIAIPNLVLDFVVLLLPVIPLWRLQMDHRQKMGLLVVFILGYT
jgi:hypothetical protein